MKHPIKSGQNVMHGMAQQRIVVVAVAQRMLIMTASINVTLAEKSGKVYFFYILFTGKLP